MELELSAEDREANAGILHTLGQMLMVAELFEKENHDGIDDAGRKQLAHAKEQLAALADKAIREPAVADFDLALFIGDATTVRCLNQVGICTAQDLAKADPLLCGVALKEAEYLGASAQWFIRMFLYVRAHEKQGAVEQFLRVREPRIPLRENWRF